VTPRWKGLCWSLLAMCCLAPQGCKSRPSSSAAKQDRAAEAEVTVRAFFDGLRRRDCKTILGSVGGKIKTGLRARGGCAHLFAEDPLRNLELVSVKRVVPDGRRAGTYIVRAVVRSGDRERETNIRVRWENKHMLVVGI